MKKPRKSRRSKPREVSKPISAFEAKGSPQPPRLEVRRPFVRAIVLIGKIASWVAAIIGLPIAIFHWWPLVSVEPSVAADLASNPLSGYFKITNEQVYAINDLSVEVSLRCAKIGRADDTSPIKKCEPSIHTSRQRWTQHTLDAHQAYEVSPGEMLFVTPGALLYAQLDIFVSFQPWQLPWSFQRPFRFETRRSSNGSIQWAHIPND